MSQWIAHGSAPNPGFTLLCTLTQDLVLEDTPSGDLYPHSPETPWHTWGPFKRDPGTPQVPLLVGGRVHLFFVRHFKI